MRSLVALGSAAILVAVAAACSGGHGGTSLPPMHGGASLPGGPTTSAPGSTTVRIRIPSAAGSYTQSRKRPKYVSASTLGGTIYVYPSTTTPPPSPAAVIDLSTNSSSSCTSNSDGSRTCSISVSAPVGTDTFVFDTYDKEPVNGAIPQGANLLSTATASAAVTLGGGNSLSLTLDGVVASISVSPSGYLVLPSGTSALSVNVNASDPDGNIIVGPGNYVDSNGNPVTISVNTNSTAISYSTTSLSGPGTSVTATVNGGTLSGTASITATSGTMSSSLTTQVNDFITTAQTLFAGQATPTATPTASPTPTPAPTATATAAATATPQSQAYAVNVTNFNGTSIAAATRFGSRAS